jgi:uncharacterized membrane protein YkvA (DUF1232 family)
MAALRALWAAISGRRRAGGPPLREQLMALPRLVVQTLTGRYTGITRGRLGLMALAVLYIISPVDLMPEAALLFVGLADDAVVLAWLAGAVLVETDAFLAWERAAGSGGSGDSADSSRHATVPGEVIR